MGPQTTRAAERRAAGRIDDVEWQRLLTLAGLVADGPSQAVVREAFTQAVSDLRGSTSPASLPEMATRLVAVRLGLRANA